MPANVKLLVQKSVIDLRSTPQDLNRKDFAINHNLLTQLLYNERLELIKEKGDWLFISAIEQEHFTTDWHPYQGWVHASEVIQVESFPETTHIVCAPWTEHATKKIPLSFGTKVDPSDASREAIRKTEQNRQILIADAEKFLGNPYLWGGRAFFHPELHSSVDCSGFVDLLYRAQGINIPRDAEPQRKKCQQIKKEELLPGDLIYLSRIENPAKATHVIIYNEESFLEAPSTGNYVRKLSFESDYLESCGVIRLRSREGQYLPTYGRFFKVNEF